MSEFEVQYKERQARAEERASALAQELMKSGRQEDLFRAAEDASYRDKLYAELGL